MTTPPSKTYVAMGKDTMELIEDLYFGANLTVAEIAGDLGWTALAVRQHVKVAEDRMESGKLKLETILSRAETTLRTYVRPEPKKDRRRDLSTPEGWNAYCQEVGAVLTTGIDIVEELQQEEHEMPEKKSESVAIGKSNVMAVKELMRATDEANEQSAAKAESDRLKKICFPIVRGFFGDPEILVSGFNSYLDGNGVGQISITIQTAGV